jgi:hypothetical protein
VTIRSARRRSVPCRQHLERRLRRRLWRR